MIVNMHEAQAHLAKYVNKALSGEEVIFAKAGEPMVALVPLAALKTANQLVKLTQNKNIHALKGVFSQYADTSKMALEKSAWQQHLLNKYRHD